MNTLERNRYTAATAMPQPKTIHDFFVPVSHRLSPVQIELSPLALPERRNLRTIAAYGGAAEALPVCFGSIQKP